MCHFAAVRTQLPERGGEGGSALVTCAWSRLCGSFLAQCAGVRVQTERPPLLWRIYRRFCTNRKGKESLMKAEFYCLGGRARRQMKGSRQLLKPARSPLPTWNLSPGSVLGHVTLEVQVCLNGKGSYCFTELIIFESSVLRNCTWLSSLVPQNTPCDYLPFVHKNAKRHATL